MDYQKKKESRGMGLLDKIFMPKELSSSSSPLEKKDREMFDQCARKSLVKSKLCLSGMYNNNKWHL